MNRCLIFFLKIKATVINNYVFMKTEADQRRTSTTIRGRIRCNGGVSTCILHRSIQSYNWVFILNFYINFIIFITFPNRNINKKSVLKKIIKEPSPPIQLSNFMHTLFIKLYVEHKLFIVKKFMYNVTYQPVVFKNVWNEKK